VTEKTVVMTFVPNFISSVIHSTAIYHFQMQWCLKGKLGLKKEFNMW